MRLIDAEHLRAWILARWEENDPTSAYPLKAGDILDQIEREMNYSTVDVVSLIRCKDCRWYKTNYSWDGKEHRICAIEAYEPVRKADDFCNRAERKEE